MSLVKTESEIEREMQALKDNLGIDYEITLPFGYYYLDGNLYYSIHKNDSEPININICPFFIIKNRIQTENGTYILIKTVDREIPIAVRDDLKTKIGYLSEVLQMHLSKNTIKALDFYFEEYLKLNKWNISTIKGLQKTGWNGDTFYLPSRQHNDVVWLDDNLTEAYQTKGTQGEQEHLFKYCMNTQVSLLLLACLSTPLLKKMGVQNYGVLVSSLTGRGKTTAAKYAASLQGNPDALKITWDSSNVGKELTAKGNDCLPLWVDELETQKNPAQTINYLYEFESGKGRTRGNKLLKVRQNYKFHSVLIATGEKDLDALIEPLKNSRTTPKGVFRRVIELKIDENFWNTFDGKNILADKIDVFLSRFNSIVENNYGWVGLDWIEWVEANLEDLKLLYKEMAGKVTLTGGMNNSFALLLTVLHSQWMKKYLTDDTTKSVEEFILSLAKGQHRKTIEIRDIAEEFLGKLTDWVSLNTNKIIGLEADTDYKQGVAGQLIHNNVDIETLQEESKDIFLLNTVFDKICTENGFVKKQVLTALNHKGLLKCDKDRLTTKWRLLKVSVRGYRIRLDDAL